MSIPIIDFRSKDCVIKMYDAYSTCGFCVFTHVYDNWLSEFEDWGKLMEEFFQLPLDVKKKYQYSGVVENLGYNWLEEELLINYNYISVEDLDNTGRTSKDAGKILAY